MTIKSPAHFLSFSQAGDSVLGLDVPFSSFSMNKLPVMGLSILSCLCESPGFSHCLLSPSLGVLRQCMYMQILPICSSRKHLHPPFFQPFCCLSLLVFLRQSSSNLHSCPSQYFHYNSTTHSKSLLLLTAS